MTFDCIQPQKWFAACNTMVVAQFTHNSLNLPFIDATHMFFNLFKGCTAIFLNLMDDHVTLFVIQMPQVARMWERVLSMVDVITMNSFPCSSGQAAVFFVYLFIGII